MTTRPDILAQFENDPYSYGNPVMVGHRGWVEDPATGSSEFVMGTPNDPSLVSDYILGQLTSGQDIPIRDFLYGNYNENEIIPRNPVANKLAQELSPLYGTKTVEKLMKVVGVKYGLTEQEIANVAGQVSADMYRRGLSSQNESWRLGRSFDGKPWMNGLFDYIESTGKIVPPDLRSEMNTKLSQFSEQLGSMRDIESDTSGFFKQVLKDVGPILAVAAAIYGVGTLLSGFTAAGTTTASSMLAAESAALMEMGFTAAEVSSTLAGLGNASQIASIMTTAGVPAAEAMNLATQTLGTTGGSGMSTTLPVDEWGSMNDYGVGEGVLDDPSLWTPDENFYYDDWNMGSDASGNMSNASGRAWQDVAAESLRNAGFDRTTAAKLVQGAGSLARQLLPNGSASDLAKLAAQLIGNNQAHNAVEDTINKYADRLEGLSPISKAERDKLGDIGMERFGRDYLGEGRDKWLYNEYGQRGAQADNMAGMLSQLYTDPTQLSSFNAINDLATANTMRMQGARGTLQSGSTSNDYRNAAIKSMLELAQPMNQSLSTMYSGQQVPVQAFNALSGANNAAFQQGEGAIRAASGTQSNLASFMPTAFEASLRANPTLTGNQAIFGSAGQKSASDPSVLNQLAQFGSAAKGIKDGWTTLSSLF